MLTEKYRPKELDQVLGQKEIIKSLKNLIQKNNLPHALLFSGANGLGKTTIARIIASNLDAEIIEIDGASFGKIEVMREIQETICFPSLFKTNKVLIVDECHGLSKQAFDSLLKLIEEPPSHVYFIFCTTEPDKVVKGVMQRCIHYRLQPVEVSDLKAFLRFVSASERYNINDSIINLIAVEAKGSPRQALNLLFQLRDVEDIDEAQILLNTSFDRKEVYDLCRNIIKKEGFLKAVKILEQIKDLNPYSIKIQIMNYLNACIFNARNEKEATYFLTIMSSFDKTNDTLSSIMIALGEIYFEVR